MPANEKIRFVLLDRDNTLNFDPGYINNPKDLKLKPGVTEALNLLKKFDFQFAIITNQSGISRKLITLKQLKAVNNRLLELLKKENITIKKIYFCPHTDEDNCECRKPKPGLIKQAQKELKFSLSRSYIIGDKLRDIKAAEPFNIDGILVYPSDAEKKLKEPKNLKYIATDLKEAAQFILQIEFEKDINLKIHSSYKEKLFQNTIQNLRKQKKKIVFTNGCFDILHSGHLQYLWQASKLGDALVVAANSDDSVKRLKGKSRPVNTLKDRLLSLSALPFTSVITSFSEDTPIEIIKKIKPDIHVKGGDYKKEDLPEYSVIKKYKGEVVILPFRKGYSTTDIIKKTK